MQPPLLPDTQKVSYQVPRDTLARIWWRRMMLRSRGLYYSAFLLPVSVWFLFLGAQNAYIGLLVLSFVVVMPILKYQALAKAVDNDRTLTDPKTLEFSASRLVVTGPDWKTEVPWTRYRGFSEDHSYFYLHLSDNGIASVIPKSAFSAEQQQRFRQYAQARIA